MDVYVDYSVYTKPSAFIERTYHSASNAGLLAGVAKLESRGDSSANSHWVAVYDRGARSFMIALPKHTEAIRASVDKTDRTLSFADLRRAIEYVYCNDEASLLDESKSRVALRGVVDSVEDLADGHEYLSLDRLLSLVEPQRLRPITAVAFLRSSYAVKARLSNWNGLYQVVYAHLSDIGENPKRLMRGLSLPKVEGYA